MVQKRVKPLVLVPTPITWTIDLSVLVDDKLIDMNDLKTFIQSRFKVQGRVNNFRDRVTVDVNGPKLVVITTFKVDKKYFSFLVKKYFCKASLKNYVRLTSPDPRSYVASYYNAAAVKSSEDAEDAEDAEEAEEAAVVEA